MLKIQLGKDSITIICDEFTRKYALKRKDKVPMLIFAKGPYSIHTKVDVGTRVFRVDKNVVRVGTVIECDRNSSDWDYRVKVRWCGGRSSRLAAYRLGHFDALFQDVQALNLLLANLDHQAREAQSKVS